MDPENLRTIIEQHGVLRKEYSEGELLAMLDGELQRLKKERTPTLSISESEIVSSLRRHIANLVLQHPLVSIAVFEEYVVEGAFQLLVQYNYIDQGNVSRDHFVIVLLVAIVWDYAYKLWQNRQTPSKDVE